MNTQITVKKATLDDLPGLYTICRQSYSENFAHHWNDGGLAWYLEKVYSWDGIAGDLADPHIHYFIAYYNEEPAGFMKVHLNSNAPDEPSAKAIEIEKLYFRPHFQGKGIGKMLIAVAFDLAKDLKRQKVWLGVIDTNTSAIEFYKKMGFMLYDKIQLDLPYFKEELKGMWRMTMALDPR
jgi:ribosomal protein S18 acetylase RimI-like enzyme